MVDIDDPSSQNVDNGEVHNITKSWPDPMMDASDMAVGTPPLLIFSLSRSAQMSLP